MFEAVPALWLAWCAGGMLMERRAQGRIRSIRHRILVGGMRGKTSLVHLIHEGFRAAGVHAVGRTTGDEPLVIDFEGNVHSYDRVSPAHIREIRRFINGIDAQNTAAVVVENMAIKPEHARTIGSRMVLPTVQVLAADSADHLDVYPSDPAERAGVVLDTLDSKIPTMIVRSERNEFLLAEAEHRGFDLIDQVDMFRGQVRPHVVPLLGAAAGVLNHLGLMNGKVIDSILARGVQLQKLRVVNLGNCIMLDVMSANDPASTTCLIHQFEDRMPIRTAPHRLYVYNHRQDRSERLWQYQQILSLYPSIITGDPPPESFLNRVKGRYLPSLRDEDFQQHNIVYFLGNTGGAGHMIRDRFFEREDSLAW